LAVYTASLCRLLKAAKERQKDGLEPYTGVTGFNTMTVLMKLEKDFEDTLGFTFSEFFASYDEDELKAIFNIE